MKKRLLLFLVCLAGIFFSACGLGSGKADPSRTVNLVYYLWGGTGPANEDILRAINTKMKEDINATVEIRYIDFSEVTTRYPLLFASGEPYDMTHASHAFSVSYFTLATQGALADITDRVETAAPLLKSAIPHTTWDQVKSNGRIFGVPTLYVAFNTYGFAYSRNLREKYNLAPVNSFETMETYLDTVARNESFPPLNGDSYLSNNLYRLFIAGTNEWLEVPGIEFNQNYLVVSSHRNFRDVFHPAFTDEFLHWAVRMHDWNARGFWPRDILSASTGDGGNFNNGNSAGFIAHQPSWTGNYGTVTRLLPGVETDFWPPAEDKNKIVRMPGVENVTVINTASRNIDKALAAIEKFMTDQDYYELIQYGIKGRQWELENGVVKRPASFIEERDRGGFAAWSMRNDMFNLPAEHEDPRRYILNDAWKAVAIDDPFAGFAFNPGKVNAEISAVSNVNSQLGIQIMLGKTPDPAAAVEQYRRQLRQAGIDAIIAEVKNQLADYDF